jgi:SAM-dependent methyltransferase
MTDPTSYRFYGDLARWWPLISPPEDYAEEAAFAMSLLGRAAIPVRDVLEVGSGGGHNAVYFKESFAVTLVDLSEEMLDVSRRLNPDCDHHRGDMRTIRLGREFDAVFIHDAIDYMTDEADLRMAMETAFVHCRPGGIALFMPDEIRETYEEGTDHGGNDAADGGGVRYLEWDWDPDPDDTSRLTEYAFLLREVDGSIHVVHETHRTGLFGKDAWLRLLLEVGFEPETVTEVTTEDRLPRELFIGRRPLAGGGSRG